jgi:hypothetical protein
MTVASAVLSLACVLQKPFTLFPLAVVVQAPPHTAMWSLRAFTVSAPIACPQP